jgi:hypothetical protein
VPDSFIFAFVWPKSIGENLPPTRKCQDLQAFTALGGIPALGCGIAGELQKALTLRRTWSTLLAKIFAKRSGG